MDEQAQSPQSKGYKVRPIIWAGGFAAVCLAFLYGSLHHVHQSGCPRCSRPTPERYIRNLVQAFVLYAGNHDDQFPDEENWEQILVAQGLVDVDTLVSMAEDGDGVSYIFVRGLFSFDSTQIVVYEDPKHFEEGVLVGFADGHVELIPHEQFQHMLTQQLQTQSQSP